MEYLGIIIDLEKFKSIEKMVENLKICDEKKKVHSNASSPLTQKKTDSSSVEILVGYLQL